MNISGPFFELDPLNNFHPFAVLAGLLPAEVKNRLSDSTQGQKWVK